MNVEEFVKPKIVKLDDVLFEEIKNIIFNEYVELKILDKANIGRRVMAEKLCDFFEKAEFYNSKNFESLKYFYSKSLDEIVKPHLLFPEKSKSNKPLDKSRALQYYEKAKWIIKSKEPYKYKLLDYSRIMLCLYSAIINNDYKEISDFDYSVDCLNLETILDAMKKEKCGWAGNRRFELEEPYSLSRCVFVFTIMMFYSIKRREIVGEN